MVQAKFKCDVITETTNAYQVKLSPVYSNDKGSINYSWSVATPSGNIELSITNKNAKFNAGKEYLITFEEV